jgi:hypothetical protein
MKVFVCNQVTKFPKRKIVLTDYERACLIVRGCYANLVSLSRQLKISKKKAKHLLFSRLDQCDLIQYPDVAYCPPHIQKILDRFIRDVTLCVDEAVNNLDIVQRFKFVFTPQEFERWVGNNAAKVYDAFRKKRNDHAKRRKEIFPVSLDINPVSGGNW